MKHRERWPTPRKIIIVFCKVSSDTVLRVLETDFTKPLSFGSGDTGFKLRVLRPRPAPVKLAV
jgi:alpha-tubulin suppressor-like RCC1 family protein